MWLQLLISSFSLGSFYALVALGFSIVFGVTRAFNLAHGELILISGYSAYSLERAWNVPLWAAAPICISLMLLLMLLFHQLLSCIKEPYEINTLVFTFGLALVLQNLMLIIFSADYRLIQFRPTLLSMPALGGSMTSVQLLLIVLSLLATGAVYVLFRNTFLGKALRATIQHREAACLSGIHVERMSLIAFGIGGVLIGLAGPLFALTSYLHPSGGTEPTLIGVLITIFAGLGRVRGILVGGWILGLVESMAGLFLGISWRELISSVILIALLLLRPEGVMGKGKRPGC
jgi:branched-chain amino acid transport system permease protein